MAWRRALRMGLSRLVRSRKADRDLEDEVSDFRARLTAEYEQGGLSPAEAARRARLDLGRPDAVKEEVRQGGWETALETTWRDARLGARALGREPAFTLVVMATLAIGIGATTAIFSAVYPILLEPLPYPQADRLVAVADVGSHGQPDLVTYGTFLELIARCRSFDALAVADVWQPALTGDTDPERLAGERVSAAYFRALGVAPALGRDFAPAEDRPGAPRVAILSDGLARRHFGRPEASLGRPINLDGDDWLVIGVLPPTFEHVLASAVEVWAPRRYRQPAPANGPEAGHHLTMIGRMKAGLTPDQVRRELDAIARTPVAEFARVPWADLSRGLLVRPLQEDVTRDVRATLVAMFGAVGLVLAIACVNVTNLLLARLARRRGEFALRAALGAGRARLVRQLLTESLVFAIGGGLLGLGIAAVGVRALVAQSPPGLPRLASVHVNGSVFLFALAVTALVALLIGLAPAFALAGRRVALGVHLGSGRETGRRRRVRQVLVVAEVAVALVLLVGAGLLARSLARLFGEAPGFEPSHVLTLEVQEAGHRYDADPARLQFFRQALDAVRAVPGVSDAAFTSQLPLSGDPAETYGAEFADVPNAWDDGPFRYAVTPDYFRTMQIPLRRGRLLSARDVPGATTAVVLSESYARHLFPDRDPIGERVRFGPDMHQKDAPWAVVVGLVGDVKQASLTLGPAEAFYVSTGQWNWVDTVESLVVRTSLDPAAVAPAVKAAIWSVDRNQPVVRIATMGTLVARSEAQRTFALMVFELFASVSLLLAAIGLYGVLSGSVTERTREIGVRAALGASRGRIVALILGEGLSLTVMGLVVGLAGAVLATPAVGSLLFGVSRLDPATHVAAVAIFLVVATVACAMPAWRAVRVDALTALRE
jgi:putative ABC transport system permease protein